MSSQDKLKTLAAGLNGAKTEHGLKLSTEIMPGEVDVLIITVEDREEFPIYLTVDDGQVLCITHLWTENEVRKDRRMEMLDAMLTLNIPMPLSAFSKAASQYLIYGALSNQCSQSEVLEELEVLSNNTLTAVEEFSEFLVKK